MTLDELMSKICQDIREGILTPEQIADKYVECCGHEEYRQAVINKIIELRNWTDERTSKKGTERES